VRGLTFPNEPRASATRPQWKAGAPVPSGFRAAPPRSKPKRMRQITQPFIEETGVSVQKPTPMLKHPNAASHPDETTPTLPGPRNRRADSPRAHRRRGPREADVVRTSRAEGRSTRLAWRPEESWPSAHPPRARPECAQGYEAYLTRRASGHTPPGEGLPPTTSFAIPEVSCAGKHDPRRARLSDVSTVTWSKMIP
jgi:hypothetical protein